MAWLLAATVVVAACGADDDGAPEPDTDGPDVEVEDATRPIDPDDVVLVVATHADALEAMADSIAAGSWRWEGAVDMSFTDADRERLLAFEAEVSEAELDEEIERLTTFSARGALGEDGSWQTAWVHDGRDIVDLRLSGGELFDASTLEPEVTVLLRVDWPYVLREFRDVFGGPGDAVDPEEELALLRQETQIWLAGSPFQEVVLAFIDGDWAGISGIVDLASFDVTQQDLDAAAEEFREELIGLADRDTTLELIDRSVTLRDFVPAGPGGGSVATLDVHPQEAAFAIYDLFDDAADLATGYDDDLPETLEAVATVTFDEHGMMTEVSTDVLAIMRQVAAHEFERGSPETAGITREDLDLIEQMEGTTSVVFSFSDHGQVPTVLDVRDAVTTDWGELADLVADLFIPRGEPWETQTLDDLEAWDDPEAWDDGWDDWPAGEPDEDGQPGLVEQEMRERSGNDLDADAYEEFWRCLEEGHDLERCNDLVDR